MKRAPPQARRVADPPFYPVSGDPTHYPVRGEVGERSLQRFITELLRPLVERWLTERGVRAFVGADQFIYWRQYDPICSVAPDVFVIPGARPGLDVGSWKTWETGLVPSFAFEVVSGDPDKDYLQSPVRYADLGVRELIVFDPDSAGSADRVRWQVFRRSRGGALTRVLATDGDRVRSRVLQCWLRAVGGGDRLRVRLATGLRGHELYPTPEERAERAEEELAALRRAGRRRGKR